MWLDIGIIGAVCLIKFDSMGDWCYLLCNKWYVGVGIIFGWIILVGGL